jgi:hypothetical protein
MGVFGVTEYHGVFFDFTELHGVFLVSQSRTVFSQSTTVFFYVFHCDTLCITLCNTVEQLTG